MAYLLADFGRDQKVIPALMFSNGQIHFSEAQFKNDEVTDQAIPKQFGSFIRCTCLGSRVLLLVQTIAITTNGNRFYLRQLRFTMIARQQYLQLRQATFGIRI